MVFFDAPYIVRNAKLFSHIAQILVIAHNARNIDVPFTSFPASQQVVQTMAHFANKNCHSWTFVTKIQFTRHLVALSIQCIDVFLNFIAWNQEMLQFPFNTHKKHAVLLVHILVKVNDISLIICNKSGYLRNNSLLVRTMQKQYCGLFHSSIF